jgi:hypothetical protein
VTGSAKLPDDFPIEFHLVDLTVVEVVGVIRIRTE